MGAFKLVAVGVVGVVPVVKSGCPKTAFALPPLASEAALS